MSSKKAVEKSASVEKTDADLNRKSENKMSNSGRIFSCRCKHKFQDSKYGTGRRYHNAMKKMLGIKQVFRCTVCISERTA